MIFLALIGLTVVIYLQYWHAEKYVSGAIITGPRGSGKTRLLTIKTVRSYRWQKLLYKLHLIKDEPRVYSNVPLRLTKHDYAYVLKREHILMTEKLPEGSMIFWDEQGTSANQYSSADPNVITENYIKGFHCLENFQRFYRHFIGKSQGTVGATDQATGDVNIQIRRRYDKAYQLEHFRRWLWIMPFYKVNVRPLLMSEGDVQNVASVDRVQGEKPRYFFGFLPYKWMDIQHYDTYCYSLAYDKPNPCFVDNVPFDNWQDNPHGLKTDYIIELRQSDEEKAATAYQKWLINSGKTYREKVGKPTKAETAPAKPQIELPF